MGFKGNCCCCVVRHKWFSPSILSSILILFFFFYQGGFFCSAFKFIFQLIFFFLLLEGKQKSFLHFYIPFFEQLSGFFLSFFPSTFFHGSTSREQVMHADRRTKRFYIHMQRSRRAVSGLPKQRHAHRAMQNICNESRDAMRNFVRICVKSARNFFLDFHTQRILQVLQGQTKFRVDFVCQLFCIRR